MEQENLNTYDRNAEIKAYCKALFITCLWVGGIIAVRTSITSGLDKAFGTQP